MKISEAELEVMQVVWDGNKTSLEIINNLTNKNWTKNTIRTLIKRLVIKEALEVIDKKGKAFIYKETISEKEYQNIELDRFIKTVFRGDKEKFLKTINDWRY